jgi:hypothetical protein
MMSQHLKLLLGMSLLALGCGSAATPAKPTDPGPRGDITWDSQPISVKKGESSKFTVTGKREKFQGEIRLEFKVDEDVKGLTFEPAVIPADKDTVEVTVKATADAAGGFVEIIGHRPNFEPYQGPRLMVTVR